MFEERTQVGRGNVRSIVKSRGFTLLEILAVIAIIAVIAGIAFPVFGAVKRRAQHTACAERLHQLGTATVLYANDHDGWVPPATTAETVYEHVPGIDMADVKASPAVLRDALRSYVKSDEIWFCPADPQARKNVRWLAQRHLLSSYFFYPVTPGQLIVWPPKMMLGRDSNPNKKPSDEDIPLWCDAAGVPTHDSDPPLNQDEGARSNHPDSLVNAIQHDLSLSRKPARYWMGTDK